METSEKTHLRGVNMNPSEGRPNTTQRIASESAAPSLRRVTRKSALLNAAIVLTSFPVLALAGGPNAIIPALKVMAGITIVIWTATFSLFYFLSLARLFGPPTPRGKQPDPLRPPSDAGVADRWLDGPA
jgi:hypothetical protein